MKKNRLWYILPVLCLLLVCLPFQAQAAEGIAIDEANFPDTDFREHLRILYDKNGDGLFSQEELDSAHSIVLLPGSIQSLAGIEYFQNLEVLDCHANAIYHLDLSANTKLRELHCQNNELTTLDVSANTALTYLDCSTNLLTELDVSANVQLKDLYCFHNRITSLSLQTNPELRRLECNNNALTTLDLSANPKLDMLDCSTNALTALDVSQNKYLTNLNCSYNQISDLKFYNLLKIFSCGYNQLTSLDVRSCTRLTRLICCDNQLTSLDISQNTALNYLNCERNQLSISLSPNGTFDLATLPGFDVSKTTLWVGGSVSGSILTVDAGASTVSYAYKCSSDKACSFTLIPVAHQHSFGAWSVVEAASCEKDGTEQRICTSCNQAATRPILALGHDFAGSSEYLADASGHSKKCTRCNAPGIPQPHEGGSVTCTEPAICTVCQGNYGTALGHSFTQLMHDETHHWNQCIHCGILDEKLPHAGGTASCTKAAVCSSCMIPYGQLLAHSYSDAWRYDTAMHWKQCACGAQEGATAHSPGPAATEEIPQICTQCQAILQPATGHVTHSYTVLQNDLTHHWYKCSGCNQISQQTAHDGGTASCTSQATCSDCGTLYGQLAGHSFTLLQSDRNYHWYRCDACDAIHQKTAHSYDDTGVCADCGSSLLETPLPTLPEPTEPAPTQPVPTEQTPQPEPTAPELPPEDDGGSSLWIYLCGLLSAAVIGLGVLLAVKRKKEK